MKRTGTPGTTSPAKHAQAAEIYDFRRPTTLAREHSRVLELAFDTFARQWGTQLTSRVRVKAAVVSEQVIMQSYDEYSASLPSTTAMVLCKLGDTDAKAVIQFPTSSGLSWVGRMLGGNGSLIADERKFTQIEQSLIKKLMDDALEDLTYSMGTYLPGPAAVEAIHYNSQFAQAAAPSDLMIVAAFTITVGENVAEATLALPAETLLAQLGSAHPTEKATNAGALVRDQLAQVPVDIAVQLSPAAVKPGAILNLSVGDLLALPHSRHMPLDVAVDGQRLAQATAGTNGSRIAAIIVSTKEYTP